MTACDGTSRENDVEFYTMNDAHVETIDACFDDSIDVRYAIGNVSPCFPTSP